jgi:signal transduction histidine kinase
MEASIREVAETGVSVSREDVLHNLEGQRWYETLLAPVISDDLTVNHVVTTSRDVTDRHVFNDLQQQIIDRLEVLRRTQQDFVSQVSHELRSPLTGILGYAELLEEDTGPLTVDQLDMVRIITRHGHRLLVLVEDLLTMSRIESGTFTIVKAVISLAPIIESALANYRPEIEKRGLVTTMSVPPRLELEADAVQLERVVGNLIANAIKFTDPGGRIDTSAHRDGGDVVITVRDSGIGIPREEQSKLFTRFFRSSLSMARQASGTGLGLYIVKRVVEEHGGSVRVVSAPGVGSEFIVRLPIIAGSSEHEKGLDDSPDDTV